MKSGTNYDSSSLITLIDVFGRKWASHSSVEPGGGRRLVESRPGSCTTPLEEQMKAKQTTRMAPPVPPDECWHHAGSLTLHQSSVRVRKAPPHNPLSFGTPSASCYSGKIIPGCRKRKERPDRGSNPGLSHDMQDALTTELPGRLVGGIINSNTGDPLRNQVYLAFGVRYNIRIRLSPTVQRTATKTRMIM